jgi:hypothetical protein
MGEKPSFFGALVGLTKKQEKGGCGERSRKGHAFFATKKTLFHACAHTSTPLLASMKYQQLPTTFHELLNAQKNSRVRVVYLKNVRKSRNIRN